MQSTEYGVVTGCDQQQEWLLPWWWENYAKHNEFPFHFVDFGMSDRALSWCKQRGTVGSVALPQLFDDRISAEQRFFWEGEYQEQFWTVRRAWFKKPLALLQAPFDRMLWLDLDCEVRACLESVLLCLHLGGDIVIKPESMRHQEMLDRLGFLLPGEISYNSGVVALRKGAPLLHLWVEEVLLRNHLYRMDQSALSRVIFHEKPPLVELPEIFHWDPLEGDNPLAHVVHYYGLCGKEVLKQRVPLPPSF